MEINAFINQIYESKEQFEQVEYVQKMRLHIEDRKDVIIGDIKRVFIMINTLLDTVKVDLILQLHMLIETLIKYLLQSEIEQNMGLLCNRLLLNLADAESTVRKSTKRVFISYIKKTQNFEEVVRILIDKGLTDRNYYVRERSINLVPDAIQQAKSIFSSKSGINEARRILEAVIIHLNDKHQSVNVQAQKVLKKIKKMNLENFDQAFKRISVEHQQQFAKAIQEEYDDVLSQEKFTQVNLDSLDINFFKNDEVMELSQFFKIESSDRKIDIKIDEWNNIREIYKRFLTNDIKPGLSVEKQLELFPQNLITKLYFGFLRGDIIQDCLNDRDPRVRQQGLKELNQIFFELEESPDILVEKLIPEQAYSIEVNAVEADMFINQTTKIIDGIQSQGFVPQFFKFISFLLSREKDFRATTILMNIMNKIIQIPGIHASTYLPLCLPGLVSCLNDQRVITRRRAFFLLRKLIYYIKKKQYFLNVIMFLDDTTSSKRHNNNWHVKEELLNLLSMIILETKNSEEWFYGPQETKTLPIKQGRNIKSGIKQQSKSQISQNKDQKEKVQLKLIVKDLDDEQVDLSQEQPQISQKLNLAKILIRISYFLDDKTQKVRQAALENLTVFCNTSNKKEFLEILYEVLDEKVYGVLIDKLETGRVYFLNINGNLELPIVDMRRLEKERREFDEQQKLFEQNMQMLKELQDRQQRLKDEEERQKEEQRIQDELDRQERERKKYRVTYYEEEIPQKKQFQLSRADRIKKSNQSIIGIFTQDHQGIDSIKYDR